MKDGKTWSSQVELSLGNRQIFLLFFASAVVLSLVFALGVVVGKRMDNTPARTGTTDPLALLDQMGGDDTDENLSYQQALSPDSATHARKPAAAPKPATNSDDAATAESAAAAATTASPKTTDKARTAVVASVRNEHNTKRDEVKPAARPSGQTANAKIEAKTESKPTPAVEKNRITAKSNAVAASAYIEPVSGKDKSKKPKKVEASAQAGGDSYTLQLSSFQEKREAETFMEKLRKAGLKPYMTSTEIPGRGTWFRVRLGHFKSWDEAITAKQTFEKEQKAIAYVSKSS